MTTIKDVKRVRRVIATLLALALPLPSPAFGLRDQEVTEKKPDVLSGLGEALRGDPNRNVVSPNLTAGMEEDLEQVLGEFAQAYATAPEIVTAVGEILRRWKEVRDKEPELKELFERHPKVFRLKERLSEDSAGRGTCYPNQGGPLVFSEPIGCYPR